VWDVNAHIPRFSAGGWMNNLMRTRVKTWGALMPGLITVSILTGISIWLGEFVGTDLLGFEKSPISPVMIAILLGLGLSSLIHLPKEFEPGLKFSVKRILRLGIILLGIRLSIFDVLKLGTFGLPIVVVCIMGAFLITTYINKRLHLPRKLGALIAVGTSICGVTAIIATGPAIDADEEESAYAVAVITIFGLFATIFYPYLANTLFADDALKAGLFLGTAVHETAQVVGAAKIYADIFSQSLALDVATVAKLVRNVFIVLVIPIMAYRYADQDADTAQGSGNKKRILKLLPLFILGFLGMATLRSLGDAGIQSGRLAIGIWNADTWLEMISSIKRWAEILLVAALAGVGLGTKFSSLKALGIKPFIVGLGASLSVGVVSFVAITLLGSLVIF
jgi:uncharacterized integral membrane protein (TIGR00698 family)